MESPATSKLVETDKSQQLVKKSDTEQNQCDTITSIHDLYHYTLQSLGRLAKRDDCEQCTDNSFHLKRCLGLLYMWAQGLDLRFLQNAVDQDTGLQKLVVRELAAIVKIVHAFLDDTGDLQGRDSVRKDVKLFIDTHTNSAFDIDDDTDTDSDSSTSTDSADLEPRFLHGHHVRQLSRLKMHVQCLMDLLPTIEHCCNEKRSGATHEETTKLAQASTVNHIVRPYVMQVQDKFASIDPALANRLGEANWARYKRLQALSAAMNEKSGSEDDDEEEDGGHVEKTQSGNDATILQPHSEFFDSGLGASIPAKSRYNPSVVSHTSLLSTQSAINRGSLRVPPTPAEVAQGLPFRCQICGVQLSQVKNRIDWKLHVFADILPYICTVADCPAEKTTFSSRKHWAVHDIQHHRTIVVWRCFKCNVDHATASELTRHLDAAHAHRVAESGEEQKMILRAARTLVTRMADQVCPMCKKKSFKDERDWTSHVARHMEEVALVVLPRYTDSDDDEDNEESTSGHDPGHDDRPGLVEPEDPVATSGAVAEDEDDDDNNNDDFRPLKLSVQNDPIVQDLEGFKSHIRLLNPRVEPYLVERVAQSQLQRVERLKMSKMQHMASVAGKGQCSSGRQFCVELGGQPKILPPRTSAKDDDSYYVQYKVGGTVASDDEGMFFGGVVTPSLFPAGIPLPPVTCLPAQFECPLCFQLKKFQKPSDWTKHVYEDVQPFSCTFPDCPEPRLFKRKTDWVRHENERHRHLEWWQCNIADCSHKVYRKDNFVMHLAREHEMTEPKMRKGKRILASRPVLAQASGADVGSDFWRLVEDCRHETTRSPEDEPCKFCHNVCNTWKKLSVHMAKHFEQIVMPVLQLVQRGDGNECNNSKDRWAIRSDSGSMDAQPPQFEDYAPPVSQQTLQYEFSDPFNQRLTTDTQSPPAPSMWTTPLEYPYRYDTEPIDTRTQHASSLWTTPLEHPPDDESADGQIQQPTYQLTTSPGPYPYAKPVHAESVFTAPLLPFDPRPAPFIDQIPVKSRRFFDQSTAPAAFPPRGYNFGSEMLVDAGVDENRQQVSEVLPITSENLEPYVYVDLDTTTTTTNNNHRDPLNQSYKDLSAGKWAPDISSGRLASEEHPHRPSITPPIRPRRPSPQPTLTQQYGPIEDIGGGSPPRDDGGDDDDDDDRSEAHSPYIPYIPDSPEGSPQYGF